MDLTRHFLYGFVLVLASIFNVDMALALPMTTSDITYFQAETTHVVQPDDVGFAACAPPMAVANVAVTSMQGSAFVVDGQETVAALFDLMDYVH